MNIEQSICTALETLLKGRLPGVQVRGNWSLGGDLPKGAEVSVGPTLDVSVSPRRYDSYTGPVAEFAIALEGAYPMEEDVTLSDTVAAYDTIVALLEDWRANIASVKRDLTVTGFAPVGLRLDGGRLEIDRETKTRTYTQQFTLKGRIG